ncbi:MAG: MlaD family protein, partial [Myxococcota bacterium]
LVLAAGALVLAVGAKVGPRLFGSHDTYHVRMPGGVGGLQPGASVTFNGIQVGRVGEVEVDPHDVALVDIELLLDGGTPVPVDTEATVAMQGITGLRYVELGGGTNSAPRRKPGDEIPPGHSLFDMLTDRAKGIADRLDRVLDGLEGLETGPERERVSSILAHVDSLTGTLDNLAVEAAPRLLGLMARADTLGAELPGLVADARATLVGVRKGVSSIGATVARVAKEGVDPLLAHLDQSAVDARQLVARADTLMSRSQSDLHAALESISNGIDSIGDLADMLRSDPASLVFGRSTKPREKP